VPDLPLEDAGWEDDEDHPRTAAEVVDAFQATRGLIDDCLRRWTEEDLLAEVPRPRGDGRTFTRAWVIWDQVEHELHHGTEIALILRSHGLRTLVLWRPRGPRAMDRPARRWVRAPSASA
jgi:uncharacterized damage-inducible protein DinB